jgi:hypothetical protein
VIGRGLLTGLLLVLLPSPGFSVVVGASGGPEIPRLEAALHRHLADHAYFDLDDTPVGDVRYVNIEADAVGEWAQIAAGGKDYEIRAWARALKDSGHDRLVSFNHEPSVDVPEKGTPRQFKQAFRHFASMMPANVRMVWAVTQKSLSTQTDEPPELFWPGDRAVDLVASNAFNRYGCARKPEYWRSFSHEVDPLLALGRRYDKDVVVSEFGMDDNENRDHWIQTATAYVDKHPSIVGLFYYQSRYNHTCDWLLRSDDDLAAFRNMIDTLRRGR